VTPKVPKNTPIPQKPGQPVQPQQPGQPGKEVTPVPPSTEVPVVTPVKPNSPESAPTAAPVEPGHQNPVIVGTPAPAVEPNNPAPVGESGNNQNNQPVQDAQPTAIRR